MALPPKFAKTTGNNIGVGQYFVFEDGSSDGWSFGETVDAANSIAVVTVTPDLIVMDFVIAVVGGLDAPGFLINFPQGITSSGTLGDCLVGAEAATDDLRVVAGSAYVGIQDEDPNGFLFFDGFLPVWGEEGTLLPVDLTGVTITNTNIFGIATFPRKGLSL